MIKYLFLIIILIVTGSLLTSCVINPNSNASQVNELPVTSSFQDPTGMEVEVTSICNINGELIKIKGDCR